MRPAVQRISNMEAMVLALLTEKNISFSIVSKSLVLILVDWAWMLYSGKNIRVVV